MNISLTAELEKFVQEKVQCGLYTSASEVIRESLRLMYLQDSLQKQRLSQLNQAIDIGLDQLAQGEKVDGNESHKSMRRKVDQMLKGKE